MVKAILDTSFILTCVRQKLDFFQELEQMGYGIAIPDKVLSEIRLLKNNEKRKIRDNASLALKILEKNNFETLFLEGSNADNAIIFYARKNPRDAIATLDKEIKENVKNKKIVIRGKKKLKEV